MGIEAKNAAGKAAAELVKDGMCLGVGTGSTTAYFIEHLVRRYREGLRFTALATSNQSFNQLLNGRIPVLDPSTAIEVDLVVDGADEIDDQKRMIKGGGGALLYEKIVASMSREMVVIIDSSKKVAQLGQFPLPVEIIPFGHRATVAHLNQLGFNGKIRQTVNGAPFITDGGHWIYDITPEALWSDPDRTEKELKSVTGVVEVGFFIKLAGRVITGFDDGHVQIW